MKPNTFNNTDRDQESLLTEIQGLYDALDARSRALAARPEASAHFAKGPHVVRKRLAIAAVAAVAASVAAVFIYSFFNINYCDTNEILQIDYLVSLI